MTSVTTLGEEEPMMSKTHDHQLQSSLNLVEVCTKPSACLEMTQGNSKERSHFGSSPEREGLDLKSLHLSPEEHPVCHQDRRQSWRRASMKEINRRKSLPPFHQGITELSKSISMNLAASKRLGALLLSSFQFSVDKLEPFLKDTKGFNLECFRVKASSLAEELKHFTDRLESDGTLQKCFEDSKQESTETKITEVKVDPVTYLGSSQSEVLNTKPDYRKILQNQNKVFEYMELVMDELQGSGKQLQAFMDESTACLQKVSAQLEKRSLEQSDSSPARKLLRLHLRNSTTTQGSGYCQ